MKLKAASDAVGKPVYLEMSSINPVLILPGALAERWRKTGRGIGVELFEWRAGQFCIKPGLVIFVRRRGR